MKRATIATLALFALLLAGCGPVASPTHYEYDSHAVTTTSAAEMAQKDNRPVCVGIIVLGSCNTTATQTQGTTRPAPAPTSSAGIPTLADIGMWLLITAMCCALFCLLIGGIKWIYRDNSDGGYN